MSNVKVTLHRDVIKKELLTGSDVMDYIESIAREKAASCGAGYAVNRRDTGATRGNVSIYAATHEAVADNLNNNTLLKKAYTKA